MRATRRPTIRHCSSGKHDHRLQLPRPLRHQDPDSVRTPAPQKTPPRRRTPRRNQAPDVDPTARASNPTRGATSDGLKGKPAEGWRRADTQHRQGKQPQQHAERPQ